MFIGADLCKLTKNDHTPKLKVQDCINLMTQCNPATIDWCLRQCKQCRDSGKLNEKLLPYSLKMITDIVKFKQKWTNTDRSHLESIEMDVEAFTDHFCDLLKQYQIHDFIKKNASYPLSWNKKFLRNGEVLVVCDFSEDYSFIFKK